MLGHVEAGMLAGLDDDGWFALIRKRARNGAKLDRLGTCPDDKRYFTTGQYSP